LIIALQLDDDNESQKEAYQKIAAALALITINQKIP